MAESVRLPIYSLLLASLVVLYAYWETSLQIPIFLLVAVHCIFVFNIFSFMHPRVRVARKFVACLSLTFSDTVFTSYMLGTPITAWFSYLLFEFVFIFVLLHRLHPHGKMQEMEYPLLRGMIYLVDGFFMAVGVSQGLEKTLVEGQALTTGLVLWAAAVVIGKNILSSLIFLVDEFFCEEKPVREIKLDGVVFGLKAGVAIFLLLGAVWHFAPKLQGEFSWCMFASNVIYLSWGALDTIAHQQIYSKVE